MPQVPDPGQLHSRPASQPQPATARPASQLAWGLPHRQHATEGPNVAIMVAKGAQGLHIVTGAIATDVQGVPHRQGCIAGWLPGWRPGGLLGWPIRFAPQNTNNKIRAAADALQQTLWRAGAIMLEYSGAGVGIGMPVGPSGGF